MKNKIIYLIAGVIFSSFTAFAQGDSSSDDTQVDFDALKPKAGDFGIGVSAIPYLNYLGNFFGKEDDNNLSLGDQVLYGKYFLTDASAVRVAVYANNYTDTDNFYSQDDAALAVDPASTAQVVDTRKWTSRNMSLTLGYEMRKDRNRFTFLYGANIGYGFSRFKTEYTYGNPISGLNPEPTDFFGVGLSGTTARTLSSDNGITHTISAGLFAGLEFFVAKQIALGADFSLGYALSLGTQSDATYEEWNGTEVYEFDRPSSPGSTRGDFDTNQYSSLTNAGAIYVHFYF